MAEANLKPDPENRPTAGPPAPAPSRKDAWLEVVAVLCIGVLPLTSDAVTSKIVRLTSNEYYSLVDSARLLTGSCFVTFAVLYLMFRSGEPLARFGIMKPAPVDVLWGLIVCGSALITWRVLTVFWPAQDIEPVSSFHPAPRSTMELAALMVAEAANAVAEELVCRAYLLTRFLLLLRSKALAIFLSAALFASYHVYYDAYGLAGVFLTGLVYGWLFVVIRRAVPLAVGHMLGNLLVHGT